MPQRVYKAAHASVRFFGPSLDPLIVTKALELPADYQHRAGEPRLVRTRRGKIQRSADFSSGHWSMSSERWVDSPRLDTHLDWVLAQLEPRIAAIEELLKSGVSADIFCYSFGATPELPPLRTSIRERAEALGLSIEIDHYQEPEPSPSEKHSGD